MHLAQFSIGRLIQDPDDPRNSDFIRGFEPSADHPSAVYRWHRACLSLRSFASGMGYLASLGLALLAIVGVVFGG